jgi:hypothetical protein
VSANGTLQLTEVRARVAAILAPTTDDDPAVLVDVVDAISPPAILLIWDDPWLTPQDGARFGPCVFDAQLMLLCIAGRVPEPGPGIETLEWLIGYAISRLQSDPYPWPQAASRAPRQVTIGGVRYLGAWITYRVPVSIEGGS